MKSWIKTLDVRNIGLFDELTVEFDQRMNIIIGSNGAGKTSILRYITYVMSRKHLTYSRWRQNAEVWLTSIWNDEEYTSGFKIESTVNERYRNVPATPARLVTPKKSHITRFTPNNIYVIGAYRRMEYQQIKGMSKEESGTTRQKYYEDNATQFLEGKSLPGVKQWMINRYFSIDKDWSFIQRENWEHIMTMLPEVVPQDQGFRFVRIERDLEPVFYLNGKECYLEELSSGFKSFLAVIFSIIDWCEGVNEGDAALMKNAAGTVLIDEIDAHLHPQWQAKIIGNLKMLFPKLQFIVTTHSPHVVASAEQHEVIRIPEHRGMLKLRPQEKSYKGWQLEYILEDLMGFVSPQENTIDNAIDKLSEAFKNKNLEAYEQQIKVLEKILHPKDPILTVYKLKKSQLILNKD